MLPSCAASLLTGLNLRLEHGALHHVLDAPALPGLLLLHPPFPGGHCLSLQLLVARDVAAALLQDAPAAVLDVDHELQRWQCRCCRCRSCRRCIHLGVPSCTFRFLRLLLLLLLVLKGAGMFDEPIFVRVPWCWSRVSLALAGTGGRHQ